MEVVRSMQLITVLTVEAWRHEVHAGLSRDPINMWLKLRELYGLQAPLDYPGAD
jgi:hypothetical protein